MASGFQLARRQAEAYHAHTGVFMDGSARLLADGAGIGPGDVVLDLACGTGLVAGHAAPLVGPSGRVVGVDVNAAMLEVARSIDGDVVEFVESSCESLPFEDATFTHVLCQQGLQFFPDPVGALREAGRVLRPGAVLIATVWATPEGNPYIEAQLALFTAIDPSVGPSVARATPAEADRFLATTADAAGLVDVGISVLDHVVHVPDLGVWFVAQTGGTPWGPVVAALSDDQRLDVCTDLRERLRPFAVADGHDLPFRSFRLTAARPTKA